MTRAALVLRAGGKHEYRPEHAQRLCALLDQHLPAMKRIIFADVPVPGIAGIPLTYDWPSWWAKMELFRPDVAGDLFYMDLDVTPVADLTAMANVGKLTALSDRNNLRRGINSSVMYLPHKDRMRTWQRWQEFGPEKAMRNFRGDQDFLNHIWGRRCARYQTDMPGCAVSFKQQVLPAGRVPESAAIVYYHGKPKGWEPGGELPCS